MRKSRKAEQLLGTALSASLAITGVAAVSSVALLASADRAEAQDYTSGTLQGEVVDETGAPVANAAVTVRSLDQGFTRNFTTGADGEFRAQLIPQGTYEVTIESEGNNTLQDTVQVSAGQSASFIFTATPVAASGDEIIVTGQAVQALDFNQTTQGLNVDLEELVEQVPVQRNITAVTLLAPSTSAGDSTFGNLASIGGGSVAENAYYINGLNVTNFDTYLGGSTVPFEFYKSVEVKTSGYPAEYGRATGGIVNAVSKSGSNEFMLGVHGNWEPAELRDTSPDTNTQRNELDEARDMSMIVEAGGPIIPDRLFFYGLVEVQESETKNAGINSGTQTVARQDDPFYALKLDGYVTDDHHLEFTYFDTTRSTDIKTFAFDPNTDTVGGLNSTAVLNRGGESFVGKYTGTITDWLTISAAYGENSDRDETLPGIDDPYVVDSRTGESFLLSQQATATVTNPRETKRKFYRVDADIFFDAFGDHHVRMGYEKEELNLTRFSVRTGPDGAAYFYNTAGPTDLVAQGPGGVPVGTEYLEVNIYRSGGSFDAENTAYYIQDEWNVNDRLSFNLGVRLDQFANFTADGTQFIDFDEEIGPRLGFAYDPMGDGVSKIFGAYSIYYLPVAANTAYRQAGSEVYFREFFRDPDNSGTFEADEIDQTTGLPIGVGSQIVNFENSNACPFGVLGQAGVDGCQITGDGSVPSTEATISKNLKATKEEEWLIGYERQIGDLWTASASLLYRDLLITAEDVAIDRAVLNYCEDEDIAGCENIWTGFHQYVIINPGEDSTITLNEPLPGETTPRTVDFSAQELNYPAAKRTYTAAEFTVERTFDGVWGGRASYTLSESKGNTEGYVKSDNGQNDAGITQDFDQPGLTDGTLGLLPNHHAHVFKVFGSYQAMENLRLGINGLLQSPRKYGCIGVHPTDSFAALYGAASFYCGGELTPRGSQFESDWLKQVDMSLRYTVPEEYSVLGNLVLRADVFNIFGFESVTDLDEFGETGSGVANPNYQTPISYQTPRYVRLGFDWEF